MNKKEFYIRLGLFFVFAFATPCVYLISKYNLFKTTNSVKINVASIIVIAILIVMLTVMIKYYLDGMKTKYSILKQILHGVIKVILPLTLILLIITWLGNNVVLLKDALYIIIPCEAVAIVINPLPKWCFDNNVEGIGEIAEKIFSKKKGDE